MGGPIVSRPKRKPEGDYLLAYCWCGRNSTYVEGHHIRDGKTWQCSKACWTYYKARGPKFPDTFRHETEQAEE